MDVPAGPERLPGRYEPGSGISRLVRSYLWPIVNDPPERGPVNAVQDQEPAYPSAVGNAFRATLLSARFGFISS